MLLQLANSANSSSDQQPMASPLINPENMLAIDIIDAYRADRHNYLPPFTATRQIPIKSINRRRVGASVSIWQ